MVNRSIVVVLLNLFCINYVRISVGFQVNRPFASRPSGQNVKSLKESSEFHLIVRRIVEGRGCHKALLNMQVPAAGSGASGGNKNAEVLCIFRGISTSFELLKLIFSHSANQSGSSSCRNGDRFSFHR